MEKTGKTRIICSVSGCSREAAEDSNPPLCERCGSHEKQAVEEAERRFHEFGLKASAEMSEQLWDKN